MGYSTFTEEQITQFIETAQEMGIGPSIRYLGYPKSYHTAKKWFGMRGLELPTLDTLAKMAGDLRVFYSDKEKIIAAQAVLDRCVEALMEQTLDSDALNKLANAVHKAIQTINLIEGKSTVINEQRNKDGQDLAIIDLLNEAKARNEQIKNKGLKVL
jgi:transcriptional regulator with XRE-family HTH domain